MVPGNFTFVLMTDREDLDEPDLPDLCRLRGRRRQDAARRLRQGTEGLLKENHRYVFSLIHKFNQDVNPHEPYSERDDIIVISDEAHRTQAGKLARNMRLALPNAAFIGFTGTPLFKHDHLTERIFGNYVSRYDFKRSEEDGVDRQAGLREPRREARHRPARPERPHRRRRSKKPNSTPTRRRCWRSCSARTTRSSPPTTGWTSSPPISSSTARRAGSRASPCSCASTRSPAPGCSSGSCRAGRRSGRGARR